MGNSNWRAVVQLPKDRQPSVCQKVARDAEKHAHMSAHGVWVAGGAGNVNAPELLASAGKGKPLPAIVERVGNMASSLNVTLLPDLRPAAVLLAGVQVRCLCCLWLRRPCAPTLLPKRRARARAHTQRSRCWLLGCS